MIPETMSRQERFEAVVALEMPDRVPVMPLMTAVAVRSESLTPWFHFDTDWGLNLPYLKQLPKGKCVCDLDGTTDIFKAKEALDGHMCISGDVPASLLTLGTPEKVRDYCQRLIDEVGKKGGFFLTTGCECPVDARLENVKMMIEVAKDRIWIKEQ